MGKHKKKTRRDTAEIARSIVEHAIGEPLTPREGDTPDEKPEEQTENQKPDTRNPAAVALSKLGASKGGKARAAKLNAGERAAIARKAAVARWKKADRSERS